MQTVFNYTRWIWNISVIYIILMIKCFLFHLRQEKITGFSLELLLFVILINIAYHFHRQRKSIKNEELYGFFKDWDKWGAIRCPNFNLMIPIEEEQLQLVDTTIFKRDRDNIKYYKRLCVQELEWCRNNSEVICNKANVLYKKYISNEPFTGRNRCLNFPKLMSAH